MGGAPTFGPRVGGTPKIAVEPKMEQGFHSAAYDHSINLCAVKLPPLGILRYLINRPPFLNFSKRNQPHALFRTLPPRLLNLKTFRALKARILEILRIFSIFSEKSEILSFKRILSMKISIVTEIWNGLLIQDTGKYTCVLITAI